MDKKVILTAQGIERINAELDQLVKIGLPEAEEKLDLTIQNNGDVQDATAYRDFCRDRIANLGEMLCAAKVVPDKSLEKRWISVNNKLPETKKRVLVRFETTFKDKQIPHVTIADYIAPRTVLESEYMDEEYAGCGDYDEENDCYWTETGWYESGYETEFNQQLSENVTHWMPLPSVDLV